jgi:hypothetical protein
MAQRDEQKQRLVKLLGPLDTDDSNEDGHLNWAMQCTSYEDMKTCAVWVVNLIRSSVGVQGLVWDEGLANDAQAWAQRCASMNTMQHATWEERKHQGENIYAGTEWSSFGFSGGSNSNGSTSNGNAFLAAMLSWTIDDKDQGDGLSEKGRYDRQTGGMDGHYSEKLLILAIAY